MKAAAAIGASALALASCGGEAEPRDEPAPELPATDLRFSDATAESGLGAFVQVNGHPEKPYVLDSMGGGVALFDYDGDGWLDAYLTNGMRSDPSSDDQPSDALYRNTGGARFVDVTASVGLGDAAWTQGAFACDVDGDARPDLYLTNWGANALHLGGEAGFRDVTAKAGVGDARWSTGAAFLDHDEDGDLDLYVSNYVAFDFDDPPKGKFSYRGIEVYIGPRGLPGERDTFYVNRGDGTFADATEAVGVADSAGYGFQVVAFDYDEDGFADLYVGNDSTPNYLWRNLGGERFEDQAFRSGCALSKGGQEQAGMGVAVGDANGDGRFDLYVTNFSEDYFTLYVNDGGGFFRDGTLGARLAMPTIASLGWGCGIVDLDSDGDRDVFAVNGHVYPQVDRFEFGTRYLQANQLFEQTGGGRFVEVTEAAGPGFQVRAASRGAAYGDLDNDGDLDLLVGNIDGPPTLLRNDTAGGNWAKVRLRGSGKNSGALGAVVTLTADGRTASQTVGDWSGFLSTNDARLHFGLGRSDAVDALAVHWPDGSVQELRDLPAGKLITVTRGEPDADVAALR